MSLSPTVLYPLTLVGLLHHILTTQAGTASTTLIVCSTRDAFLQQLLQSLQQDHDGDQSAQMLEWTSPSLHNLLTTRGIQLAFCASVQALLAYLTVYRRDAVRDTADADVRARIVLVNPLSLHASTLSFSAQGLSRSFAAATETALKTGALLHVVECQANGRPPEQYQADDVSMCDTDEPDTSVEADGEATEEGGRDPWEQEVSILNVSSRRFGSNSGERAWAGRTVKAKRIAARWFRFQRLHDSTTREGQG